MKTITANQGALLRGLAEAGKTRPRDGWYTPAGLIGGGHIRLDSSLQGLHQTAASLRRKKMIERKVIRGIVHYQITDAGLAALQGRKR